MTDPVLFPDAEAVVVDYLTDELGDQAELVATEVPADRPDRFVLVRRTGGPRANLVSDAAQLTVDCWGSAKAEAHDLAQVCRAHLFALRGTEQGGTAVYRVDEFGGPVALPDPLTALPRYTFTVIVHLRGAALPIGS